MPTSLPVPTHLGDALTLAAEAGELVRVPQEVDSGYELAELTRRIVQQEPHPPVVFFERVRGNPFPAVTHRFGSLRRLCRELGVRDARQLADRVGKVVAPSLPEGLIEKLRLVPDFGPVFKSPPNRVSRASVQQVVRVGAEVSLKEILAPRCWPEEPAGVWHSALVITTSTDGSQHAVDACPVVRLSDTSVALCWTPRSLGAHFLSEHRRRGLPMPVGIVFGACAALTFAAHSPLPTECDPRVLAGFLRGVPLPIVQGRTQRIDVPAEAEFVLEGVVEIETDDEVVGPLASASGCYRRPLPAPVCKVTAVTHRKRPVMPVGLVGQSPQEADTLREAADIVFLPLLRLWIPESVAVHRFRAGGTGGVLALSIRKRFPGQGRSVLQAVRGLRRLSSVKWIIVTDDDIDPSDEEAVWQRVNLLADPSRDLLPLEGLSDYADGTGAVPGIGQAVGIDATRKTDAEGRAEVRLLSRPEHVLRELRRKWQ